MPTNNYILTPNASFISESELMHGRNISYIDLDEDEMMHWKYIYKKKINGKWRYYYDVGDASYIDGNTHKKPSHIVGYSWLEDKLGKDEQERSRRASAVYEQADKNSQNRSYSSASEMRKTQARVAELGKKAIEANEAYMKTPLGQLEKTSNTINKAKKVVSNWLKKLADKLG